MFFFKRFSHGFSKVLTRFCGPHDRPSPLLLWRRFRPPRPSSISRGEWLEGLQDGGADTTRHALAVAGGNVAWALEIKHALALVSGDLTRALEVVFERCCAGGTLRVDPRASGDWLGGLLDCGDVTTRHAPALAGGDVLFELGCWSRSPRRGRPPRRGRRARTVAAKV